MRGISRIPHDEGEFEGESGVIIVVGSQRLHVEREIWSTRNVSRVWCEDFLRVVWRYPIPIIYLSLIELQAHRNKVTRSLFRRTESTPIIILRSTLIM